MVGLLLALASVAYAGDIYIAQSATGSDSGTDCANAHSAPWFNANATGGNTYHLCGTFTGTAGSTMLTPPNSGSSGNIVTILFESNAILTSPYWGANGAIKIASKNYITVDGGTNGEIKNTANGTSLTYHAASSGVRIYASNNIIVKNLKIYDIYKNQGSSSSATDSSGVSTVNVSISGASSNIRITNNTLLAARAGIDVGFEGVTVRDVEVDNNNIQDHCWQIASGAGTANSVNTGLTIHHNTITDWTNWQYPINTYHTDGIILFGSINNNFAPTVHSNYIYGDLGAGSPTAFIYLTTDGNSASSTTGLVYNNVLHPTTNSVPIWVGQYNINTKILNNTICGVGPTLSEGLILNASGNVIKNNIFANVKRAIGGYSSASNNISVCDYNIYYNNHAYQFGFGDGSTYYTFAQWQALGYDQHGKNANPNLSATYALNAGSIAIDSGTSLASYFATDKNGVSRPQGSAWDIGAYEGVASSLNPLSPPTGLRISQ